MPGEPGVGLRKITMIGFTIVVVNAVMMKHRRLARVVHQRCGFWSAQHVVLSNSVSFSDEHLGDATLAAFDKAFASINRVSFDLDLLRSGMRVDSSISGWVWILTR